MARSFIDRSKISYEKDSQVKILSCVTSFDFPFVRLFGVR